MKPKMKHKDRFHFVMFTIVLLMLALACIYITALGVEDGLKAFFVALVFGYLTLEVIIFDKTKEVIK